MTATEEPQLLGGRGFSQSIAALAVTRRPSALQGSRVLQPCPSASASTIAACALQMENLQYGHDWHWLVEPTAMTASSAAGIGIRAPALCAFAPTVALTTCLQAGEPPTEDAEREWQRILLERQQLADMREQVHPVVLQLLLLDAPASIECLSLVSRPAGTRLSHTLHSDWELLRLTAPLHALKSPAWLDAWPAGSAAAPGTGGAGHCITLHG